MRQFIKRKYFLAMFLVATFAFKGISAETTNAIADFSHGWKDVPFKYEVQHPYDLDLKQRYKFDPTGNTHDFWVFFTDKPHAPPPNRTAPRTEMRLESFTNHEHMFDADLNVRPGCFACIAQVFDEAHGPVEMVIAHPDGTVTVGHNTIMTNAIDHWWNLKMTDDPSPGGKIHIYANNELVGTYSSRGPRAYYFKCGVYARRGSGRSEVWYRNIRMWVKTDSAREALPAR